MVYTIYLFYFCNKNQNDMSTLEIITGILTLLLGGTSIYTIIENIKYRKENKELKKVEVEIASTEAQSQKIDLGSKYQEEMLKMMQTLQDTYQATIKNGGDNSEIIKSINQIKEEIAELKSDMKEVKEEQRLQNKFLNGKYAQFKEEEAKKKTEGKLVKKKPTKTQPKQKTENNIETT